MNLGGRTNSVAVALLLSVLSLFAFDAYVARSLDRELAAREERDLRVRLHVIERDVSSDATALVPATRAHWDAVADDLGARADARVTIVSADGVVLGDSDVALSDLVRVENHGSRPEIVSALEGPERVAVRESATLHQRMLYVAAAFLRDGAKAGVVRVATPLSAVDASISALHRSVIGAATIALLFAVLAAWFAANATSRAVRALTRTARNMASGDLSVRTGMRGEDDVAKLAIALDQLAESLSNALREIRADRDLLRGVLTGMREGVMLLDAQRRVVMINPALREMLLLGGDAIGRPLLEVVRHAELKEFVERVGRPNEPGASEIDFGGVKPRRLLVHASRIEPGNSSVLAVLVDVTELRRLESVRRDFVANVSHELRTPVTSVRSAAETLRHALANDPDAAPRFLDIIERNAERLQRLIEDLLDLSRIEARQFDLRVEAIEVAPFFRQIVALFGDRARSRRVRVDVDASSTERVDADRRALEQVLANLLENAIKYCPGGTVTLRARSRDDRVLLEVEDTGPGIEPRHLSRLFERFYRVDAGRSRDLGGTGLGLSIVKHLVEAMGGTVQVESELGRGTKFSVSLARAMHTASSR